MSTEFPEAGQDETMAGGYDQDATAQGATAPGATAPGATAPGATAPGATAEGATAEGATPDGATGGDRALQERLRAFALESTFFLHAVADRLGMGETDFSCLSVLLVDGPASAGALAERTGLTTGAITGLVDRLERAGWVHRSMDPTDRRRVIVEPVLARAGALRPLLDPMLREAAELHERFGLAEQAAIIGFIGASTEMLDHQVRRLRGSEPDDGDAGQHPGHPAGSAPGLVVVPRDGVADGYLGFHGSAVVRIGVEDLGGSLCTVDFGRTPARVTAHAGRVEIGGSGRGRWRSHSHGRIMLHRDVRWELAVRGGASRLVMDLRDCFLVGVTIAGGASDIVLALPVPHQRVPITLSGGTSRVKVTRPRGVAVAGRIRGAAVSMRVDGHRVTSMGGTIGDAAGTEAGYDIEVSGGASSIEVVEDV